MPAPDIEERLKELREYYPSDEHQIFDEAIETIQRLRKGLRHDNPVEELKEFITNMNPAALFIDNMDEALLGYAIQWGSPALAVYDASKIINLLAKDMSLEDADEFFSFNIECSFVGPGTPLMFYKLEQD